MQIHQMQKQLSNLLSEEARFCEIQFAHETALFFSDERFS
jgi:hypothetical protein